MKSKVVEGEKHFTASVWILSSTNPKKMLLVHHKKFNKWIQPGGHIEKFENQIQASVREVKEETGVDISFLMDDIQVGNDVAFLPTPKFFMEQTIPAHGDQPLHYHLDFSYVVEVDEQDLELSERESLDIGWFTRDEIMEMNVHDDTKVIVEELMGKG